jgi:hypothetical protein
MADETLDVASLDIEAHVQRLQTIADPIARAAATELVASVLQLHSAALERILAIVDESTESRSLLNKFDADPLIRSILLLHDLHPLSTSERVTGAVRELEGRLKKRDASVELLGIEDETVKLRLVNNGGNFDAEALVEESIRDAAPEISNVEIETIAPMRSGFVSVETLLAGRIATSAGVQE